MFNNKRILITQPLVRGFNGSTLVTLELAEALQKLGAKITVYTCDYAEPAKSCFVKKHIKVDTAQDNPKYQLTDFDYIWVHSQILPISIIESLSNKIPTKIPSFIFLHMSGMDWIPDEKPWIYDLENRLSSLSLFICEEVKKTNQNILNPDIPTGFFRNPVPSDYKSLKQKPKQTLNNLLIVSNHVPPEVLEAKRILTEKHHINIDILGENHEQYTLFNKNILEQYDAVITIAKTVPYCLVSGTPVYVYDSWGGGPGWLNEHNFKDAKIRNFSGYQNSEYPNFEGGVFHRKTANQIVEEITTGYQDSLSFHQKNVENFYPDYTLDSVLPNLFSTIKARKISSFSKDYTLSVISAERFATIRFETGGVLFIRDSKIRELEKEKAFLTKQNQQLVSRNAELSRAFESRSYRLFSKLIKPYKTIKERTKRHD